MIRLGLTMRIDEASAYREKRDAVAQDWLVFLQKVNQPWILLPNLGPEITTYAEGWGVNAIVLTGGNDLGQEPGRDQTETALIEWVMQRHYPVLGVCRGMQLLNQHLGGSLCRLVPELHVACCHEVAVDHPDFGRRTLSVNSFHQFGIHPDGLARDLQAIATANDGSVEAFCHVSLPLWGLMWHPERLGSNAEFDAHFLRHALGIS